MNNFFNSFKSGVLTLVKHRNGFSYYYGENSWWLLDDWEDKIKSNEYFELISTLKVDTVDLQKNYADFFRKNYYHFLPCLYIDFDNKLLYNNFYDQPLEDRIIGGWKGIFIETSVEFLKLIPIKYRYWE